MAKIPVLVKGTEDQIRSAIDIGIIDRTGLAYISDTSRLAYIDSDFNIVKLKSDNLYIDEMKQLPDITEAKTNTLYIANEIGYIFNGEEYKTVFNEKTIKDSITINTEDIKQIKDSIGNIDNLKTDNKNNLVSAINENKQKHDEDISDLKEKIESDFDNSVVTVSVSEGDEFVKSYTFYQNNEEITTVNIPKDMVVKSGSVEVNPDGKRGTYIVLVIANSTEDKLYIPVDGLIEDYNGNNGDQIIVSVDNTSRTISASIKGASINAFHIANSAITGTKIADGVITKSKMVSDLQTSFNKIDTALQLNDVQTGTANGSIAIQGKKNVLVKGLKSAAYTDSTEYDTAGAAAAAKATITGTATDTSDMLTLYGIRQLAKEASGVDLDYADNDDIDNLFK